jgi:CRISPR-associated protein Csb2
MLGQDGSRSPVLSGRSADGRPLKGHQHAFLLPLDLDEDGRIDHVVVHAPMGLDSVAQQAVRRVRRTWSKGLDTDIIVTCAGFGTVAAFARQLRTRSGRPIAALSEARTWASITPFVPVRYMHRGRHSLGDQVRAECETRGLVPPVKIELMGRDELIGRRLLQFVRLRRPGKPQPPRDCAFGLRLQFEQPLRGPLALGYANHYGLGIFTADD